MSVSPDDLTNCNNQEIYALDEDGQIYVGTLFYKPENGDFSVEIWEDSCCLMAVMTPDDLVYITCTDIPCAIQVPCCGTQCLAIAIRMDLFSSDMGCSCVSNEPYVCNWDNNDQKYEVDYPSICGCGNLHLELRCTGTQWNCAIYLEKNGTVCYYGINPNFPIDCSTMSGMGNIVISGTGLCDCGTCTLATIAVTIAGIP